MGEQFRTFARRVNAFIASPAATAIVVALIALWLLTGPRFHYSNSWQLTMDTTCSVVTFLMVFLIASAQKRDTDALNLKLDMLIAAEKGLSNQAIGIESATEAEHIRVREELATVVSEAETTA